MKNTKTFTGICPVTNERQGITRSYILESTKREIGEGHYISKRWKVSNLEGYTCNPTNECLEGCPIFNGFPQFVKA